MLDLELRPELDAVGEPVPHHQDEAVEVGLCGKVLHLVEVSFHIARQRRQPLAALSWLSQDHRRCQEEERERTGPIPFGKTEKSRHRSQYFERSKYTDFGRV